MPNNRTDTTAVAVHYSATPPSLDIGAEWIDREHRSRGWWGCGYHVVIRRDGTIETASNGSPCRPIDMIGAHVSGHNEYTVGVCVVGGVSEKDFGLSPEDNFTPAQYASLSLVLSALCQMYPNINAILGHREFSGAKTLCPGTLVDWLEQNRLVDDKGNFLFTSVSLTALALASLGWIVGRREKLSHREGGKTHVVKSGETVFRIARLHGLTVKELLQMNPQITDKAVIHPGMEINVP